MGHRASNGSWRNMLGKVINELSDPPRCKAAQYLKLCRIRGGGSWPSRGNSYKNAKQMPIIIRGFLIWFMVYQREAMDRSLGLIMFVGIIGCATPYELFSY